MKAFESRMVALRRLIIVALAAWLVTVAVPSELFAAEIADPALDKIPVRHKTYSYDNQRFFIEFSKGGKESGPGWIGIMFSGRRNWLSGIDPRRSALVVVDMQESNLTQWPKMVAKYNKPLAQAYVSRMKKQVIPNVAKLISLFRKKGMLIVYVVTGQDRVIPQIAPSPEGLRSGTEILLNKYSYNAFATSAIDNALRENGIATPFFVGTETCLSVDHSIEDAYDRSYQTILIKDACCSMQPDLHDATVAIWAFKAFIRTTEQVVGDYPWQNWVDPKATDTD